MELVVDEDWNNTVARTPTMRPATGLVNMSLSAKMDPAVLPRNIINELII